MATCSADNSVLETGKRGRIEKPKRRPWGEHVAMAVIARDEVGDEQRPTPDCDAVRPVWWRAKSNRVPELVEQASKSLESGRAAGGNRMR